MEVGEILRAHPASSISNNGGKTANNCIELPTEIDALIDNKMYRNKFRKLIRDGHLNDLLELAKMALSKDKPSYWFAKVTRTTPSLGHENEPTYWQRSLKYLAKLRKMAQDAREIAKRVAARPTQLKAVYKALWHSGDALRHAITAEETAKGDKFKYFCWLVWRGDHGNASIH